MKDQDQKTSLDDLFQTMVKEGEQVRTKKKLTSNRKGVGRLTASRLLRQNIEENTYKLLQGKLTRTYIKAEIEEQHCHICKGIKTIIKRMMVFSEAGEHTEMTALVTSRGMYEFHYDLPIKSVVYKKFIPVCAECLIDDQVHRREVIRERGSSYSSGKAFARPYRTRKTNAGSGQPNGPLQAPERILPNKADPSARTDERSNDKVQENSLPKG